MDEYRLPDFYMPWPARQSPHLDATRVHTKAWARGCGMFEQGNAAGWTEDSYDRADFPLFLALVYPDASPAQLDAVTDFYVWSFFFDDYFFKTFTPDGDLRGARAFVARLPAFMPVDDTATPPPENPVEHGLADVWSRIGPAKSLRWRTRFARNIQDMNESWLWELANAVEERVAEPIDYVETRRRTGGVFWAADLVEYTLDVELPERVYDSRPIRVLNDVFCDTVLLRNDVLSLRKELAEGETNNAVLVALEFLGCAVQEAVDVVNDVVTARLQLAEHVMAVELGPLLDEHALDAHERAIVLAYVQGLRDAMAGDFQWETGTGRYAESGPPTWLPSWSPVAGWIPTGPRGIGTAAARVGMNGRMIGLRARAHSHFPRTARRFDPPALRMPFDARCNPGVGDLRSSGWASAMGLLDGGVWDAARFEAMDLALFTASTHPDAGADELVLVHDWHVWAFYFDDLFVQRCKIARDLAGARVLVGRLPLFMEDAPSTIATDPVEAGLADLWSRSAAVMVGELRAQLGGHIEEFAQSWLWELANLVGGRYPEPVDYVAMRRRTSRSAFSADLVCHALGTTRPPQLTRERALRVVHDAFADVGALHNDIVSYRLETESEGDGAGAVHALEQFLGCAPARAAQIVARLADVRLGALEHAVTVEMPVLLDEHPAQREAVEGYVRGLQDWLAGALAWSRQTARYRSPPPRGAPIATGIGTAATRLRRSLATW